MAIFIPLVTKFDSKGLDGAKRALANFQNFAVDVGRVAATAIAAVGVASVREAAQFETTFAKIQGLVGLTADEIADLEKAARDLGPQFGKSGNEAAEALFFITSAGLRGASAVDVLEASLKGSAIGLGNVEDIANAATAAMNTYGESNLSGTEAVDTLAEAVRLGQFAPEELAGALGRVIPISAELGVSFQETAGLIAGLTRGGLSASEAVTGIRGAMQAVLKPTGESAAMLEEYGFSAEGVRDSIEQDGLLATFGRLREAFGENDEDFTRLIGSQEGLNAVLALTGENTETYTEIVTEMTDGIGILDEAMDLTADTAQFKFDSAMATAKDSLIEIGGSILEDLLPHLDNFQKWMEDNGPYIEEGFINIFNAIDDFLTSEMLADIITKFQEMWPEIEETVVQLGELVGVLAPLLLDAVGDILPLIGDMASIMSDLGFFTEEVIGLFGEWEGETPGIVDFLNKNLNPAERLKETIRGLADALTAVREAYERLRNGGFDVGDAARDVPLKGAGGRRAGGGPVSSSRGYLVGEMGPELFVPSSGGGTIIPNDRVGGGAKISITVNAGMGANGSQIGQEIVSAIKRYERTSGPVFASA
jgi:TP901 family phage tail tape measure protein